MDQSKTWHESCISLHSDGGARKGFTTPGQTAEKWQQDEVGAPMRHSDYRTLVDRGRKAGLRTTELYRAIGGNQLEAGDQALGQADGNGFVSGYDQQGHRVYQPVGSSPRP